MLLNDPVRSSYLVMAFVQDAVTYRFTDWTEEVVLAGQTYEPWPGLEVSIPPNTGTITEKPLTVKFPTGVSTFFDELVSGIPQAEVLVTIREINVSFGVINTGGCLKGQGLNYGTYRLVRGVRNLDGVPGVGLLEFAGSKARLGIPLGIAAYPRCAWTFRDKNCAIVLPAEYLEVPVTIAAVSRKRVTLTDPDDAASVLGQTFRVWQAGFMRFNGLSLLIRDWEVDSYDFELKQEPPPDWLGQEVLLTAGCPKSLGDCTNWDNVIRFHGIGLAIPEHDPGMEAS